METKQELLERVKVLADKFADLKQTILAMVQELDVVEKEYYDTIKKIKGI